MSRNLIHTHHKHLFLTLKKKCSKIVIFVIFIICPLWRPRGISKLVSGLYYVTRDTGCNIHIGAKLFSLWRAKVFSSVATNFGPKTMVKFHQFVLKILSGNKVGITESLHDRQPENSIPTPYFVCRGIMMVMIPIVRFI